MRTIFACIVAANLALIAIVIWQGYSGKRGDSRPPARSAQEELTERSVAAFNAGDTRAFSALFTAAMHSDPAMHHAEYQRDFGRILAWKLTSQAESAGGGENEVVHEISCEKEPHARLVTKFVQEKDTLKFAEWSIKRR